MKLVLHAGAHKTGTTMIQKALAEIAPELASRGVHYVDYHAMKAPGVLSYLHPVDADEVRRKAVVGFFRALSERHGAGTLLLSSESIFSYANLWQVSRGRHFYGDIRHSAQRFADLGLFDDIRIVYYVRRQDRFLNSVYLEYVKSGVVDVPFERFYRQVPLAELSWKRLLGTMADVFGERNVLVGMFEDIRLGEREYLAAFLGKVGVDVEPPALDFSTANRSLPLVAYERAMQAYPQLDPDARRALGRQLQKQHSSRDLPAADFIDEALREEIMRPHREDNLDAIQRFLGGRDPYGYGPC
jgi:hypothetical protein